MKPPTQQKQAVLPKVLVKTAGLLLLVGTIGLTTCQTLLEAKPNPVSAAEANAAAQPAARHPPATMRPGSRPHR